MKKRMKRTCIILPVVALLMSACSAEKEDGPVAYARTMMLYSQADGNGAGDYDSAAGGSQGSDGAVFLFWNFGDVISEQEYPVPMLVSRPPMNINSYSRPNSPFNTETLYPDGGLRVMATGYAPDSGLTPGEIPGGGENYLELSLDEEGICVTDMLTTVNTIVGSATLPFDRADGEQMKFRHALSRISFKARQDESMETTRIFYRRVRISPSDGNIARKLVWNRDAGMYEAHNDITGPDDFPYTLDEGENARQLTPNSTNNVGQLYLMPGSSVFIKVTITRSEDVDFEESEDVTFETELKFNIERNAGDPDDLDRDGSLKSTSQIYAGEAYTFTLLFKEDGIELTGKECAWENGGSIIIPVYPILPDDADGGSQGGTDTGNGTAGADGGAEDEVTGNGGAGI